MLSMRLNLLLIPLLLAVHPIQLPAQNAQRLPGTWKLLTASSFSAAGDTNRAPYGPAPNGFVTYTADQRVAVIITHSDRKPLSVVDRAGAPAAERADAFATLIAYAGRYRLSGDSVIHHVEAGSVQNWVGTDLVRRVSFRGDQLVLRSPPTALAGQVRTYELVWERVGPAVGRPAGQ